MDENKHNEIMAELVKINSRVAELKNDVKTIDITINQKVDNNYKMFDMRFNTLLGYCKNFMYFIFPIIVSVGIYAYHNDISTMKTNIASNSNAIAELRNKGGV